MRLCKYWGIALLVGALFTFPALAQVANGILAGTVVDESGGVLPGVEVTVTNQGTNRVFKAVTSGVGAFRITNLNPGLYEVRIALEGFKTFVATGVKINVDEEYSILAKLEVGSVSDELTVVAGVDLVKTTDTQISTTIGQRQIVDLPLNGRNPLALITLQAGTGTNGNTNTSISGLRTSFTNITQDGINIQDNFIRSNTTNFVPNRLTQSQVGEFTVATQNQSVSSGFGASQVNFVTPSGTNNYHGEVYWVHRNSAVGATNFFDNLAGNDKAALIRNQFGFSVAGPVLKDKLLFYGNYDGFRERQGSSRLRTVLTPSARQGLFRYVALRDDAANGISAGDVVEVDLLGLRGLQADPTIQSLIAQTPTQFNDFSVGDSSPSRLLNRAGYRFNQTDNEDRDQWGFRLDYNLNDRHSFEGIYRWNDFVNDRPDIDNGYTQTPVVQTISGPKFFSTAWNWTVNENVINEVRFGANLSPVVFNTTADRSRGYKIELAGSFTNPETNFERQGRDTDTWILQDNASWQKGSHSLRFGFQSQTVRIFDFSGFDVFPSYNLGTNVANGAGFASADFPGGVSSAGVTVANNLLADLTGLLDSANRDFTVTSRTSGFVPAEDQKNWKYDIIGLYVGDSWRVHPRLTMNLGLRWEYYNQLRERDGLITQPVGSDVFDAVLNPNAVVDFVDGRLIANDFGNFAPTVGLAWDVFGDGKMAVRAAYGIAYVNDEIQRAPGNAINRYVVSAGASLDNLDGLISQGLPVINAPEFKSPLSWAEITDPASPFFVEQFPASFAVDHNLQTPYAQTWTLGVQREIGWNTAVEARYVGTRGTRLTRSYDLNQTIVRENGFLADFIRAQQNAELAQAAGLGYDPRYNANLPGSQQLPVFNQLVAGGLLTNGTVRNRIQQGEAADLASIYYTNGLQGTVQFVANPAVFVADALTNGADSTYHAVQFEVTRRFTEGLTFNANYSFGKTLTNSAGEGQTNFDPILDLANPEYDRNRAAYDVTHTFNANFIYELPFGRGRRFDISNNIVDKVLGGWEVTSIFNIQSGDPFGFQSNRGTLNRRGRASGRNRASSTLGNSGVRDLIGMGSNANGPFYIDPTLVSNFTNPGPDELGNLPRFGWNGPGQFNWDFGVVKRTAVTEGTNVEFRAEFFNFTNRPNFNVGNAAQTDSRLDINAANFGRISFTNNSARIVQFSLKVTF